MMKSDDNDDNDDVLIFQDVLSKYTTKKKNHHRNDSNRTRIKCNNNNKSDNDDSSAVIAEDAENTDNDISLAFFELANVSEIAYRIPSFFINNNNKKKNNRPKSKSRLVRIRQNSRALTHTGGVVWETSFLLLEFLLATYFFQHSSSSSLSSDKNRNHLHSRPCLGRVVEVGAGCGLLGIALAAAAAAFEQELAVATEDCYKTRRRTPIVTSVTVTETAEVLVNLQANVQLNHQMSPLQQEEDDIKQTPSSDQQNDDSKKKRKKRRKSSPCRLMNQVQDNMIPLNACVLDWTHFEQDYDTAVVVPSATASESSSSTPTPSATATASESSTSTRMAAAADTIVGTDVIFTPTLVEPLLATLQYLSHDDTVVFLCVQVRCTTSHALFLNKVALYNFDIVEIDTSHHDDHQLYGHLQWGKELECHIYQMSRRVKSSTSK